MDNYTKIYVPKPRGMIGNYHDVLTIHDKLIKSLNMIPFIKATNNDIQILFEIIDKKETTQEIVSNKTLPTAGFCVILPTQGP